MTCARPLRSAVCREADRACEEPDPGNLSEVWGGGERKQACSVESVHEVGRGWRARRGCGREDGVADIRGARDEDVVVILEERTGLIVEK